MKEVLALATTPTKETNDPIFSMIDDYDIDSLYVYLKEQQEQGQGQGQLSDIFDLKTGLTPLLYIIQKIIGLNVDLDDDDDNADNIHNNIKLKVYKLKCLKDIICSLIQYGADINANPQRGNGGNNNRKSSQMMNMIPDPTNDVEKRVSDKPFYDVCKLLFSMYAKQQRRHNNNESSDEHENELTKYLEDIALQLLSNGAFISSTTFLLLHDGARRGYIQVVKFWIEKLGADINLKGRQGLTPLHFAARSGKTDIVKYLLGLESIDITVLDSRGKTALHAATVNDKLDVIALFQQFSQDNNIKE
jgi:ankyrin repeat protein